MDAGTPRLLSRRLAWPGDPWRARLLPILDAHPMIHYGTCRYGAQTAIENVMSVSPEWLFRTPRGGVGAHDDGQTEKARGI